MSSTRNVLPVLISLLFIFSYVINVYSGEVPSDETNIPGEWPFPNIEEPGKWSKARFGIDGFNMMSLYLHSICYGKPVRWSCYAFQSEWLDDVTSFPPEWNARWIVWHFKSYGRMEQDENGNDIRWVHEVYFYGVVMFDVTGVITIEYCYLTQ